MLSRSGSGIFDGLVSGSFEGGLFGSVDEFNGRLDDGETTESSGVGGRWLGLFLLGLAGGGFFAGLFFGAFRG